MPVVANAERPADEGAEPEETNRARRKPWAWRLGVIGAVLVALCLAAMYSGRPDATSRSVTILPFRVFQESGGDNHIAAGISEALANRLGATRGLKVYPSGNGLSADPPVAAKRAGVDAVVSGAVHVDGETIRVTAQVFDARRGENIWSRRFDTTSAEILLIEDAIADEIGTLLQPGLTPEQAAALTPPRSRDAVANAEYLQGRDLLDRRVRLHESVVHFERAVALDPDFALGWAGLAEALAYPRHPEPERAKEAVRRALRLDPSLAEAHATLGFIHLFHEWNAPAAVRELRQALQLKPGSARIYDWYAIALITTGHASEAIAAIDQARAIDRASTDIAEDAAFVRLLARDFAGAERAARAALVLDPGSGKGRIFLVSSLGYQRRFNEAVTELASTDEHDVQPLRRALLDAQAGDGGQREWARLHLASPGLNLSPEGMGTAYAIVGDHAAALEWLERAYQQRSFGLMFAVLEPPFDPLRGDPRFERIVAGVGAKLASPPANAAR
jgi:serine/threonine-protein kinase